MLNMFFTSFAFATTLLCTIVAIMFGDSAPELGMKYAVFAAIFAFFFMLFFMLFFIHQLSGRGSKVDGVSASGRSSEESKGG